MFTYLLLTELKTFSFFQLQNLKRPVTRCTLIDGLFFSPHSLCTCAVKFNFVDPLLPQKTYSFLVKLVQWPMLTNPGLILVCCNPIYPYCSVFQTFIINYVCILCIFNNRKRNSEFIRPVPQAGQMLLASINSIFNYITTKKYSGLWPAADERVLREEADVHNTDFGRK